jgi:site-specific recombinase XerD
MMSTEITIYQAPDRMTLDQAITAWLDEKHNRSESHKTEHAYHNTLHAFRDALQSAGLDLDSDPALIAPLAQGWAGHSARAGHIVTPSTYNQRLAIVSSFYEYAIRNDVLHYNPMERVKRRVVRSKNAARPIAGTRVKSGLSQIDRSTPEGLRDFALLSVALSTGRRVSEIAGLRYKHLRRDGNTCIVEFERCKGNKHFTNHLEAKTTQALYSYLETVYPGQLLALPGESPLWVSFSPRNRGAAISTRTLASICETYLGTSKFHATRHTWAVTMNKKGARLTDISKGLGHSNVKITSDYLDELTGYENVYASQLEEEFGI